MSLTSPIFKAVPNQTITYERASKLYLKKLDRNETLLQELFEKAGGHPKRLKFLVDRIKQPERGKTFRDFKKAKFKTLRLRGKFAESFGEVIESSAIWFIWGKSGNGKTSFLLQLAYYLASFGGVAYNSLEEGARLSFQEAIKKLPSSEYDDRIMALHREPIQDLIIRMERQRSPQFWIIDSWQYAGLTKQQYIELKEYAVDYLGKSLIIVSHAKGKEPKGSTAEDIRYDADIKVFVDRFRAFPDPSRYGGGAYYDIYPSRSKILYHEVA